MIELRNIWAKFGRLKALKGINLHIKPQEYVVLLGPSGAGKTTLLRTVAGIIKQSDGDILLGIGKNDNNSSTDGIEEKVVNVNNLYSPGIPTPNIKR